MEQAGRKFRRIRTCVKSSMVGHYINFQPKNFTVFCCCQVAVHVVIAREGRRGNIFNTILRPFDRSPKYYRCNNGADVARIDSNFITEATADIWTNNTNLRLWDTAQHRHYSPHNMRRLRRHPGR